MAEHVFKNIQWFHAYRCWNTLLNSGLWVDSFHVLAFYQYVLSKISGFNATKTAKKSLNIWKNPVVSFFQMLRCHLEQWSLACTFSFQGKVRIPVTDWEGVSLKLSTLRKRWNSRRNVLLNFTSRTLNYVIVFCLKKNNWSRSSWNKISAASQDDWEFTHVRTLHRPAAYGRRRSFLQRKTTSTWWTTGRCEVGPEARTCTQPEIYHLWRQNVINQNRCFKFAGVTLIHTPQTPSLPVCTCPPDVPVTCSPVSTLPHQACGPLPLSPVRVSVLLSADPSSQSLCFNQHQVLLQNRLSCQLLSHRSYNDPSDRLCLHDSAGTHINVLGLWNLKRFQGEIPEPEGDGRKLCRPVSDFHSCIRWDEGQ